jgi:hypothetical protein
MSALSRDAEDQELFELGLRALRDEQGTIEQARALEERLLDALGPKALSAPPASARHSGSWLDKPMLIVGLTVLVGLSVYVARDDERQNLERHEHAAPPALETPMPDAPPPSIEQPVVAKAEPRAVEPARIATLRRKPTRASTQAVRIDELTLLKRARAALRDDPRAALRIAEQHAREYPAGVFVQEREVLAINALLKQRRSADAYERAQRFVATHESSSYSVQLRTMLETKRPAP